MGIRVEVTAESLFGQFADDLNARLTDGVTLAAMRLLALSAEQVPHDVGTLQGTGSVSTALSAQGSEPEADLTYDTPYAARLHEHPEYNFQQGRKGKYVEDPALSSKDELGAIIAKAARSA